jgi:hypothetical protein
MRWMTWRATSGRPYSESFTALEELACRCWCADPAARPTFEALVQIIEGLGGAGAAASAGAGASMPAIEERPRIQPNHAGLTSFVPRRQSCPAGKHALAPRTGSAPVRPRRRPSNEMQRRRSSFSHLRPAAMIAAAAAAGAGPDDAAAAAVAAAALSAAALAAAATAAGAGAGARDSGGGGGGGGGYESDQSGYSDCSSDL